MENKKKDNLIMAGMILIFVASLAYYYHFMFVKERPSFDAIDNSQELARLKESFDTMSNFNYEDVLTDLDGLGGGEYQDENLTINFAEDWMPNNDNTNFLTINLDENDNILFSAVKFNLDTTSTEIMYAKKADFYNQAEYLAKVAQNGAEFIQANENGSFILRYVDPNTNQNVYIIKKVFKTGENYLIFSFLTVNSDLNGINETFSNLLNKIIFTNDYEEMNFIEEIAGEELEEGEVDNIIE